MDSLSGARKDFSKYLKNKYSLLTNDESVLDIWEDNFSNNYENNNNNSNNFNFNDDKELYLSDFMWFHIFSFIKYVLILFICLII